MNVVETPRRLPRTVWLMALSILGGAAVGTLLAVAVVASG